MIIVGGWFLLQLDFGSLVRYMPLFAFVLVFGAVILLCVVESNVSSQNKEKLFIRLLLTHYFHLEAIIQVLFSVGILLSCILFAFVVDDIVLSIDMTIFPFVILPMFILGIHYRMKNFRDIVEVHTTNLPEDSFENLKPTMYARITLTYWVGSLFALICYFTLINSSSPPVFAAVFLHYGLGGLLFFSSPLLFSLTSLKGKPAQSGV